MENISGTVNKAIDVLEIFLQKDGEVRLSELAKLTGQDKATTYRLVSTLVKRRFLHQAKKNGKYSLGLKMIDCGFAIRRNLKFVDLAYLYLGKLNASQNVAANLTILEGDKSLMVEEIGISAKGLPMSSPIPKTLPLHATACGKVFLAYMSKEDRMTYYSNHILKALTKNTTTNMAELERELTAAKSNGVAFDLQSYKMGQWAVAAPIIDRSDIVVATASLIVPPSQTDKDSIQRFANAIKDCARDLSQAINQRG